MKTAILSYDRDRAVALAVRYPKAELHQSADSLRGGTFKRVICDTSVLATPEAVLIALRASREPVQIVSV